MSAKPVRGGEAIKTDRKINLIYGGLYHAKFGRMMKSKLFSSISGRYKTSRTLIVAHVEMRSVGIALCYDMGVRNPPSAFEGILARMGALRPYPLPCGFVPRLSASARSWKMPLMVSQHTAFKKVHSTSEFLTF